MILGKSGLKVSRVGVGTAPMGSTTDWHVYWGRQDEESAMDAMNVALDEGVNWIDSWASDKLRRL